MHHGLHGFGDVPGRLEHVQQPEHPRRARERNVEVPALAVVGQWIVVVDRLLQNFVGRDDGGPVGVGGVGHRGGQ